MITLYLNDPASRYYYSINKDLRNILTLDRVNILFYLNRHINQNFSFFGEFYPDRIITAENHIDQLCGRINIISTICLGKNNTLSNYTYRFNETVNTVSIHGTDGYLFSTLLDMIIKCLKKYGNSSDEWTIKF